MTALIRLFGGVREVPFPLLLVVSLAAGLGVLVRWLVLLRQDRRSDDGFLAAWGLVFFAGSARYLLPLTPAVIFTVLRWFERPWLLWPVAGSTSAWE